MSDNTNTTETTNTQTDASMAEKLAAATEKVKKQKAERTAKVVKGAHLNDAFNAAVTAVGSLKREEKTSFAKVTSDVKSKAIYVALKSGRVDLSSFTVTSDAVVQIDEKTAREKHLSKVRSQLNFELASTPEGDAALLAAFNQALVELSVPLPEAPKPEKAPKAPRVKKEKAPASDATPAPDAAPAVEAAPAETVQG